MIQIMSYYNHYIVYFYSMMVTFNDKCIKCTGWKSDDPFHPDYIPSLFPCIIDCFELFIDSPKALKTRAESLSNYKSHTTVKCFVSCTPQGQINFVSPVYGGRASDVQIVRGCGFMSPQHHMPGDQILADRGFTLKDELAATSSADFLTLAFTKGKAQLSAQEVETSRRISTVRIHIERIIGLLKNRYKILKGTLPISVVQQITGEAFSTPISSIDKIVQVCAAFIN